ncbi:hypothetical protein BGZ99_000796, partial [Dissophora globulifera]
HVKLVLLNDLISGQDIFSVDVIFRYDLLLDLIVAKAGCISAVVGHISIARIRRFSAVIMFVVAATSTNIADTDWFPAIVTNNITDNSELFTVVECLATIDLVPYQLAPWPGRNTGLG